MRVVGSLSWPAGAGLEGQSTQLRCAMGTSVTGAVILGRLRAGGRHVLLLLLERLSLAEAAAVLVLGVGRRGVRTRGREVLAHLRRTLRA